MGVRRAASGDSEAEIEDEEQQRKKPLDIAIPLSPESDYYSADSSLPPSSPEGFKTPSHMSDSSEFETSDEEYVTRGGWDGVLISDAEDSVNGGSPAPAPTASSEELSGVKKRSAEGGAFTQTPPKARLIIRSEHRGGVWVGELRNNNNFFLWLRPSRPFRG